MLVNGFSGLGVHTVLSVQTLFPHQYKSYLFVSVRRHRLGDLQGRGGDRGAQAAHDRGPREVRRLRAPAGLQGGLPLRDRHGGGGVGRRALRGGPARSSRARSSILGQLVFENDRFYYRLLHNETAFAIQRRLQFAGLQAVVLPIRVLEPRRRRRPRGRALLRPQRPRHEPLDRLPRRHALVEHLHDGLGDRRLDPGRARPAAAPRGTSARPRRPRASRRGPRRACVPGRSARRRTGCATAGPCRSA